MKKYTPLFAAAIIMALMPFFPEPHLVKQWHRIQDGSFGEPLDWLDLLIHGGPSVYLIVQLILDRFRSPTKP